MNGKYHERSLTTSTDRTLIGNFAFDLARLNPQKNIEKVLNLIPGLKFRPIDIRLFSISNEMIDHGIQVHYL